MSNTHEGQFQHAVADALVQEIMGATTAPERPRSPRATLP